MKKAAIILGLFIGAIVLAQSINYPVEELGNCQNKENCRQYCDALSNVEACLNFAESHNLFTNTELQEARKVANALKQGVGTPGNCQSEKKCDAYCSQREHIRECFNFAKKANLIPPGELKQAEKSINFIEKGESPGGCISKEECDAYCSKDENRKECMNFAIKAGFMNQKEAERYRKTGGKGPGGCQSKEECDAFCNKSENQEICFEFGKQHGLINQKEINMIQEETQKMQQAIYSASPEVLNCLNKKLGSNLVEKLKSGNFLPSSKIGESTDACFRKYQKGDKDNERFKQIQEALQSAPSEVVSCLNQKLGSDAVEGLRVGKVPSGTDAGEVVRICFEQYYAKQQQLEQQLKQQQGGYAPGTAPGEQPLPPNGQQPPPPDGQQPPKDNLINKGDNTVKTDDMTKNAGPVDSDGGSGGGNGAICCKKIINGKAQYHWDPKDVCLNPGNIAGKVVSNDICLKLGNAINKKDEAPTEGVPEECISQGALDRESCDKIMEKVPVCCLVTTDEGKMEYKWIPGNLCVIPNKERVDKSFCANN